MARAERVAVSGTAPASYSRAALLFHRHAKVKIFETRENGSKTVGFERRRGSVVLQNGAYATRATRLQAKRNLSIYLQPRRKGGQ